jgi:GAF domain-containing protein
MEDGITFTLAATDDEIAGLDAIQYLDGGPCVDSAHQGGVVATDRGGVLSEDTWHMYARATAAAGVASSLTLPIYYRGQVVGTVNLYAHAPDAFDGQHERLADALDASAEGAITNADLSFATRLAAAGASARLADQGDVDVALGILAARHGISIPAATDRLREGAARAGITEGQAARVVMSTLHRS